MEFLRKLILQTQNHLTGLTLSQRLAIGSCVALIVVSLLWLVQWGSKPELVPLLDQPISAEELAPIEQRLNTLGIEYKLVGNVVKVPTDQRGRLLAQLSEGQALPKDISIGFDKLIDDGNVWRSQADQDWRRTVALGNELAKVLREFNGVQEARVLIDKSTRRAITGPSVTPTASVFVKLANGQTLTKERTFAIASLVSRSVAGLDITKVAVTDSTGRSQSVPAPGEDDTVADDLLIREKKEEYFAAKIRGLLGIPGLLVAIHAELDPEVRKKTEQKYTKPLAVTENTENSTQDQGPPGGGPGVVPNTSKAVSTAAPVNRTEKTTNQSTFETKLTHMETSDSLRYGLKSLGAAVNVPRSYLAAIYKGANAGKEPSDVELKTAAQDELQQIASSVRTALGVKEDDAEAVTVKMYHDETAAHLGGGVSEASVGGDLMTMMRLYGGKAGLGALGAFSLLMMLMMVRKVSEGPVLPGEEPPKQIIRIVTKKPKEQQPVEEEVGEPETLTVHAPPVGRAEASEQLLVGREVDESTLRVQQVVEQIGDLIKEDPKTSADILQRWIEAEKQ